MNGMKRSLLAVCLGLTVGLALAQSGAGAQTKVDLYLKDADLLTATRMLSQQTGLQFVVEPAKSGEQYSKVNLSLADVSAETAIKYLCQAAGAYFERSEDGVYVIKFGQKRDTLSVGDVEPDQIIFRTVPIRQADPLVVMDLLKYGEVKDVDRAYDDLFKARKRFNPGDNVLPNYNSLNILGSDGRPVANNANLTQTNDDLLTLPGTSADQRGGGGGGGGQALGGGGGGQPGGGGQGLAGGGGQQGGGGASISGANAGGQGFLPAGTTDLTYNPATNELLFRGTSQAYQELLDILSRIDKAPKQVAVKVEFITTSNNLDKALGIDWNYERGGTFAGVAPGVFASSGDPVFLNYATGNVSMRLRTLLTNGRGRVVTAPVVRTFNNQFAQVAAGTTTAFFVTSNVITNGIVTTQTQTIPLQLNSVLAVRPRINGDNTITMSLSPNITNLVAIRQGPGGATFPEFATQSLVVALRVKDGETVALGGLTSKQDSFTENRIPLLSDLPIVGQLFKRTRTNQSSNELLVFVTPKIVDESTPGLGIP